MNKLKLSGKHILLLLLYSPGQTNEVNETIKGRTRIIKMMFLFKEEIQKDFLKNKNVEIVTFPEFKAYNYGPFSKEIYDDIEFFINNGFIEDSSSDENTSEFEIDEYEVWIDDFLFDDEKDMILGSYSEEEFKLTDQGCDWIEANVFCHLSENQKEILKSFKKSINESSLEGILRYVYLNYKEYAEKSKIKEKFLD